MRKEIPKEEKLIEIKRPRKIIFVGDTHGDLTASQKIIKDYLKPGNKIIFLGDYVDRGKNSKENLDFLLEKRAKNPEKIFLLQGNHEGYPILKFSPADFWQGLNEKDYQKYSSIVEKFSVIAIVKDIIALHGALPNCPKAELSHIKIGDENWFRICWGDFVDETGENLGIDPFSGRPKFGRDYFFQLMERFQKKVLIRSHDPNAPQFMFNDRCLTIFTSSFYARERIIAIADFTKEIKTAKDLEIIKI